MRNRSRFLESQGHVQVIDQDGVIAVAEPAAGGAERLHARREVTGLPELVVGEYRAEAPDIELVVDLHHDLFELLPGPVVRRNGNARLLEGIHVHDEAHGVGAQVHAVELTVDAPAGKGGFSYRAEVQHPAFRVLIERLQQSPALPLFQKGVVVLHHVGQVVARRHGGQLGPVVGPPGKLMGDLHVVLFRVELQSRDGQLVALL